MFYIGQHVVCIANTKKTLPGIVFLDDFVVPIKGKVYTIRGITNGFLTQNLCFALEEIPDQQVRVLYFNREAVVNALVWEAITFRPLKKLKIEDFTTTPVKELV